MDLILGGVGLVPFLSAFLAALAIAQYRHFPTRLGLDFPTTGPQKFHRRPTPRFGGIAILTGLIAGVVVPHADLKDSAQILGFLLIASLPAFIGGLLEDVAGSVRVTVRLFLTFASAAIGFGFLDARVTSLAIPGVDWLLTFGLVSFAFTLFAVGGLAHAVNIVDGFNGLAGVLCLLFLAAIGVVALSVGDQTIAYACLILGASVLGFLLLNYPRGVVFLGDGGAYLIGFLIAELAVLLVHRNSSVSPWFVLLLFAYPVWETFFSMYRKKVLRGQSPGQPDGLHLHMLVHRRVVRQIVGVGRYKTSLANALTSPFLWVLAMAGVVPAVLFWDKTAMLQAFAMAFIAIYLVVYWSIVRFRIPRLFLPGAKRSGTGAAVPLGPAQEQKEA